MQFSSSYTGMETKLHTVWALIGGRYCPKKHCYQNSTSRGPAQELHVLHLIMTRKPTPIFTTLSVCMLVQELLYSAVFFRVKLRARMVETKPVSQ